MAVVNNNSILAALKGALGKEIVFKQYRDKTVVAKYPDMSHLKPTEPQKKQRAKMKEANVYASMVCKDAKLRKKYEKKLIAGESVYQRARRDFLRKGEG